MAKEVLISVIGTQVNEFGEKDVQELITTGSYYYKNEAYFIIYCESEVTGMSGTTTSLKAELSRVTLNRNGLSEYKQIFESGLKHQGNYITPYGVMYVAVIPSKVEVNLTDNGGSINLEYVLEIEQKKMSDNTLRLSVREV